MELWRLCRRAHADLTGEGAHRVGGRWNNPGRPVVYLAEHPALAALEVPVHLDVPFDLLPVDDLDLDLPVVLAWRARDERFTRAAHEIADFLNDLHSEQADQATHTAPAPLC